MTNFTKMLKIVEKINPNLKKKKKKKKEKKKKFANETKIFMRTDVNVRIISGDITIYIVIISNEEEEFGIIIEK